MPLQLYGTPLDYLVVFAAGILTSFTPCIYPLIPITLAVIGAEGQGYKLKGLFLSLLYVLGIAITYSVMGVLAVSTRKIFGYFVELPLINFIAGAVFILGGLWIMNIIKIGTPKILSSAVKRRQGFWGVLVMGVFSGLAVSPCVTPILASILALVAKRGHIFSGGSLLFVYAYGMGFVLILVGTFGALLTYLPKSGKWLGILKNIYGIILIGIGASFLIKCLMLIKG